MGHIGGMPIDKVAVRSGMFAITARKYRTINRLPTEAKQPHTWRTRTDSFKSVWKKVHPEQSPVR